MLLYNANVGITYDPSKTLKFKLFKDVNLMVITNTKTGDRSIYDPTKKKLIGTLYDSRINKDNKHFESWILEILNMPDIPETKRRFIEALYIINPDCYKYNKYEIYDLVLVVMDMLYQEIMVTGNSSNLNPTIMLEYSMTMNKYVYDKYRTVGVYSCDEYDALDEQA